MKKLLALSFSFLFLLASCSSVTEETVTEETPPELAADKMEIPWFDMMLTDVRTGDAFSIAELAEKPVLIESFAVWCPTCKRQQDKILELHEELGDSFVSLALDTDPNEDSETVLDYAESNGYTWLFAVSPAELTSAMIDEFGISVVNAPLVPVILFCEDESATLLKRGVKSAKELKTAIENNCS